jgi:UDP-glucose:(glucosyl)LPS beta-1,3-glucosyltransferase
MQYPLVTLLTPCFNTGKYIHRLLDSVLKQTYPNIEMYVIDDGSTDNSKEIFFNYKELFSQRGFSLNYLYQKNSGQSVAIQNGLQYVHGKYIAWPDSDDFYAADNAIERRFLY